MSTCYTNGGGSQFTNFVNGTARVTVVGELIGHSTLMNQLDIFSTEITVPETGVSIPTDTILGRTKEINDIFDGHGQFAGTTTGNDILIERTMSVTFLQDFVYMNNINHISAQAFTKDTLRAMILGDAFETDAVLDADGAKAGSSTIKVAGTNGVVKRGRSAVSDLAFGALFYQDGKFIVPQASDEFGRALREPNSRVTAYNTTALTVMLEFLYEFSTTKRQGYRLVYSLNGELQFTEDTEANNLSFNAQLLCDTIDIQDFWIYGGNSVLLADATSDDYFIEVPSLNEIAIDETNGEITLMGSPLGGNLPSPVVFYCPKGVAELSGGNDYPFPSMVLSCDGGTTAVSKLLDLNVPGGDKPGTKVGHYCYTIYNFDVVVGGFVLGNKPAGR